MQPLAEARAGCMASQLAAPFWARRLRARGTAWMPCEHFMSRMLPVRCVMFALTLGIWAQRLVELVCKMIPHSCLFS